MDGPKEVHDALMNKKASLQKKKKKTTNCDA